MYWKRKGTHLKNREGEKKNNPWILWSGRESLNCPDVLGNKLFSLDDDWPCFSKSAQWPPETTTKHIFPLLSLCVYTFYMCVFCLLKSSVRAFKCVWEQIADRWVGRERVQGGGFCIMLSTLMGLPKYHIYFTCGFQGWGGGAEFIKNKTNSKQGISAKLPGSLKVYFLSFPECLTF